MFRSPVITFGYNPFRFNIISSMEEIKRLSTLPCLESLWLEGNPICELEGYRNLVLDFFVPNHDFTVYITNNNNYSYFTYYSISQFKLDGKVRRARSNPKRRWSSNQPSVGPYSESPLQAVSIPPSPC